eukprot:TRINITY_DN5891_c0_g1_i1.p1 TRINITY_DN5891_c0_g1~~TRINITY_DN5891_c0_g1_i1.p1  ORF type:complete len:426 (-),score=97.25 TRINITY_DN5891_c0_g1_i1:170-1447(-)
MLSRVVRPLVRATGVRNLNLHEYQAKYLLEDYNVRCQKGKAAATPEEAAAVAEWILTENPAADVVCKAQVHAGGRGKGHFNTGYEGGVQLIKSPEEALATSKEMLGNYLITKQTTAEGQFVSKVLLNEGITINNELYLAILMDRSMDGPVVVASTEGGMEIEEVAEHTPEKIFKEPIDIMKGIQAEQTERIARALGFESEKQIKDCQQQIEGLYNLFIGTDATQVEINPLAVGGVPGFDTDLVYCVDAKLNFDDFAAFRHQELFEQRDVTQEDARDVLADDLGLNYIGLDGNIGCMVNGAGLAMATMDVIKLHGGEPANFLDVGGSATKEMCCEAFKLLNEDTQVEAMLVNIFGGIMRCDIIAEGIVAAVQEVGLRFPLVVRLEGTNVEAGKKIIEEAALPGVISATDLNDAAKKAVKAAEESRQ